MGRYIGLITNKGKGGGGLGPVEPFDRASGISTDSNNNVTAITLGDIEYTNIVYRASDASTVGLITAYTETIGGVSQEWNVLYESGTNLVTQVRKPPGPPTYNVSAPSNAYNEGDTITFTVSTTNVDDGTQVWWHPTNYNDFVYNSGGITINNNTASFTATLSNDFTPEGSETFQMRLYGDGSVTQLLHTSSQVITINDTSTQAPQGQESWTTPGTYTWVCPADVTSIAAVAVGGGGGGHSQGGSSFGGGGGGGLGWKNGISVTPGQSYTIQVGAGGGLSQGGGNSHFENSSIVHGVGGNNASGGGNGGSYTGDGGGNGGNGIGGNGVDGAGGSGGGAGGYSGSGGAGGQNGSGGGGGGGGYHSGTGNGDRRAGGGGVGLLGEGASGQTSTGGGSPFPPGGTGGSGGTNGTAGTGGATGGNGGVRGGGGGGGYANGNGGNGGVRIIWGPNRSFPSTNTGNVTPYP